MEYYNLSISVNGQDELDQSVSPLTDYKTKFTITKKREFWIIFSVNQEKDWFFGIFVL